MSSTLKKFIKSVTIYSVGIILPKAVAIALLPLYTKIVDPESYGYFDLTVVVITLVTSVVYFDIWIATLRYMHKGSLDIYAVAKSGIYIFALSSIVLIAASFFIGTLFNIKHFVPILIYGIAVCAASLIAFISRGSNDTRGFMYSGAINTVISAVVTVFMLTEMHSGIVALYCGTIAGSIAQIAFLLLRKKLLLNIVRSIHSPITTKSILIYSLPLVLNTAGYWMIASYGRMIVGTHSLQANGLYAIAFKFSILVTLITSVFNYVWQDTLFEKGNKSKKDRDSFLSKGGSLYLKLLLCGTVVIVPLLYIISPFLIDEQYLRAVDYIPLLIVVAAISAYIAYLGSVFHTLLMTGILFYSTVVAAIVSLVTIPPAVAYFGPNGASVMAIISMLMCVFIREFTLRRRSEYAPTTIQGLVFALLWILLTFTAFYQHSTIYSVILVIINSLISLYVFKEFLKPLINRGQNT